MKAKRTIIGKNNKKILRREFVGSAATTAMAFMIVPRHVLGGPGDMPPNLISNKISSPS